MNDAYIKLGIAALLPVAVAVILFVIDKYTPLGRMNRIVKQVIFGIIFGGLAVIGTEYGIPLNGAQCNCRDAAVLVGGLMFGAPTGIIAGVIGGVERWIAVAWGVGSFTRIACSASTIIAGIYSALLRKFMFEDKRPGWLLSLAVGVVMEVFHLTMVFITNMATPIEAMAAVKACAVPMIIANGVSVMLASMMVSVVSGEYVGIKRKNVRISQTVQRRLLVTVILAFLATSYFVFSLQDKLAVSQADSLLELAIDECSNDIIDSSGENVGGITKNSHVGKTGYVLIFDENSNLISAPKDYSDDFDAKVLLSKDENETFALKVGGAQSYCRFRTTDGYRIVSVLPESEALQLRNIALYVNSFMEILVFAIMFALIYLLIKKVVVDRIKDVNTSLSKITEGDLGEVVDVRTNEEFSTLSDDINTTVDTLKKYISEASARIDKELELAKNIQSSALPNVFPAFPKRHDFDIFALMDPAKEVGGDFYDFYITNSDTLNFLVADVSGKGIPAAMFMMRAKTELKSLTESDLPLNEVFTASNRALCEGNDAGMFVTAWQGGLDLTTGKIIFANAGHNPPLVRHADGKYEYLRSKAGFVLAGMEGVSYKAQELDLVPGDVVFLYTDGVTEATNGDKKLYGEDRLLEAINSREFDDMKELCEFIKSDVDAFVGDAPQFDDITMVALRFIGTPPAPSVTVENADISDIPKVTEFIESELEKIGCPMKTTIRINIAIDELFSNIVKYGYPKEKGPVTVEIVEREDPHRVYIKFTDEGIPYNPLTKEDPDVTLSAEERNIGGLGIFMVKKTMDDMKYRYENGKNMLTIMKKL